MLPSVCASPASCQITESVINVVVCDDDRDVMGQEKSFGKEYVGEKDGHTLKEQKYRRKKSGQAREHKVWQQMEK